MVAGTAASYADAPALDCSNEALALTMVSMQDGAWVWDRRRNLAIFQMLNIICKPMICFK
jgi:hypothetical protein